MTPKKQIKHEKRQKADPKQPAALRRIGRPRTASDTPFELPIFDSMKQCAAITFFPKAVMQKAKEDPKCEAFRTGSRVDFRLLLKWYWETEHDPEDEDLFKRYHGLREKLKYSHEHGETLSKTEIHFAVSKAINAFFSLEDRQANIELPPELKGLSEIEVQSRLLRASEAKKQAFIVALGELGKEMK